METNCTQCNVPIHEVSEKLTVVVVRLERIVAAQEEMLELYRGLANTLHPAEVERRERNLVEGILPKFERAQERLERRLTIRWLSVTSLFGFIVYLIQNWK